MDLMRSLVARDFGGHRNVILYQQALTGTKNLITTFQETMVKCLQFLSNEDIENKKVKKLFYLL